MAIYGHVSKNLEYFTMCFVTCSCHLPGPLKGDQTELRTDFPSQPWAWHGLLRVAGSWLAGFSMAFDGF